MAHVLIQVLNVALGHHARMEVDRMGDLALARLAAPQSERTPFVYMISDGTRAKTRSGIYQGG